MRALEVGCCLCLRVCLLCVVLYKTTFLPTHSFTDTWRSQMEIPTVEPDANGTYANVLLPIESKRSSTPRVLRESNGSCSLDWINIIIGCVCLGVHIQTVYHTIDISIISIYHYIGTKSQSMSFLYTRTYHLKHCLHSIHLYAIPICLYTFRNVEHANMQLTPCTDASLLLLLLLLFPYTKSGLDATWIIIIQYYMYIYIHISSNGLCPAATSRWIH